MRSLKRTPSGVTTIFFTRSGSGGCSIAVVGVPTRPPKSGMSAVVPAGCGPRGRIDRSSTASTSPFSAPATAIGPFCGFR